MPVSGSGLAPEAELAGRLQDRMACKQVRDVLRRQVRAEAEAQLKEGMAAEAELHNVLVGELDGHICAVCFDVMAPAHLAQDSKNHSPVLLVPCGHNLCSVCVDEICRRQGQTKCPYCRQRIESHIPNRPLEELVVRCLECAESCSSIAGAPHTPCMEAVQGGDADLAGDYVRRWMTLHAQIQAMESEEEDLGQKLAATRARRARSRADADAIEAQHSRLAVELDRLTRDLQRIAEQRGALELRREGLRRQLAESKDRAELAENTAKPLRSELARLQSGLSTAGSS